MPKAKKEASPAAPDPPTLAGMRQELVQYEMPTFGTDEEIAFRFQTLSEINRIQDAPEWLLERTPATSYRLIADSGSAWEQELELTFNEYESVKLHLAKMRGYQVAKTV